MRYVMGVVGAAVVAAASLVSAQSPATQPGQKTGPLPPGWHVRLDDPAAKNTDGAVKEEKDALTFTTGPAGLYWKDGMKAEKAYELSAVFSQLKPSETPGVSGLFIGGADLDKPAARYMYFVVRQDGKFTIRSKSASGEKRIVDWLDAESMKEPKGVKTSNTLVVRTERNTVRFLINDKQVFSLPRPQVPDGIAGVRINQNLDVQVSKLALKKL
jgi:hypothetical protein